MHFVSTGNIGARRVATSRVGVRIMLASLNNLPFRHVLRIPVAVIGLNCLQPDCLIALLMSASTSPLALTLSMCLYETVYKGCGLPAKV